MDDMMLNFILIKFNVMLNSDTDHFIEDENIRAVSNSQWCHSVWVWESKKILDPDIG